MTLKYLLISLMILTQSSCGSSGSNNSNVNDSLDSDCNGSCSEQALSSGEVSQIIKSAVAHSTKLGVSGTFSIVDRVGNVLALYQMEGAVKTTLINGQTGASGGLENASVPSSLVAISKAGTGAYLSSQANAFSTRTASQIVQENFDPGEFNQSSGPLFGVQFSQLLCSDILEFNSSLAGPKPLPLGLSADPGGLPLYKNGSVVGGLGVEINGVYTFDRNIRDIDTNENLANIDEYIAIAAAKSFAAPASRLANKIFLGGKSLRFSDVNYEDIESIDESQIELDIAELVISPPFFDGVIRAGSTFGNQESGIANSVRAGVPSSVLTNGGGTRFSTRNATSLGGIELQASEVEALLDSSLFTASRSRAAIRRPQDSSARVSIWVVDHLGTPLGFTRSQDAPVFGIDVALQKARTAAFFSSNDAAAKIDQIREVETASGIVFEDYIGQARSKTYSSLFSDSTAFTSRAISNISRPFFPDGIQGSAPGSFSLPFPGQGSSGRSFSPFNTGLQLDLILRQVLAPLKGTIPDTCTNSNILGQRLGNGIQIFPGSNPLYRDGKLIGAIGVSGDGVDQDDFISFYSASREGLDAVGRNEIGSGTYGFNAPKEIRADNILFTANQTRLRYINCPEAPLVGANEQKLCKDL